MTHPVRSGVRTTPPFPMASKNTHSVSLRLQTYALLSAHAKARAITMAQLVDDLAHEYAPFGPLLIPSLRGPGDPSPGPALTIEETCDCDEDLEAVVLHTEDLIHSILTGTPRRSPKPEPKPEPLPENSPPKPESGPAPTPGPEVEPEPEERGRPDVTGAGYGIF